MKRGRACPRKSGRVANCLITGRVSKRAEILAGDHRGQAVRIAPDCFNGFGTLRYRAAPRFVGNEQSGEDVMVGVEWRARQNRYIQAVAGKIAACTAQRVLNRRRARLVKTDVEVHGNASLSVFPARQDMQTRVAKQGTLTPARCLTKHPVDPNRASALLERGPLPNKLRKQ